MNVKRVYCPDCHVLVDAHERKMGETIRLTCCRCDRLIWIKNGLDWKYVKNVTAAFAQPETKEVKPEPKEKKPAARPEARHEASPEARGARPARRETRGARSEARPPREARPVAREAKPAPKQEVKAESRPEAKK